MLVTWDDSNTWWMYKKEAYYWKHMLPDPRSRVQLCFWMLGWSSNYGSLCICQWCIAGIFYFSGRVLECLHIGLLTLMNMFFKNNYIVFYFYHLSVFLVSVFVRWQYSRYMAGCRVMQPGLVLTAVQVELEVTAWHALR